MKDIKEIVEKYYREFYLDETEDIYKDLKKLITQYADDLKRNIVSNVFRCDYSESSTMLAAVNALKYFYMENYPDLFYNWLTSLEKVEFAEFAGFLFSQQDLKMPNLKSIENFGFSNSNITSLEAPKLEQIGYKAFDASGIKEIMASENCDYAGLPAKVKIWLGW